MAMPAPLPAPSGCSTLRRVSPYPVPLAFLACAAALLAGCATGDPATLAAERAVAETVDWRTIATPSDRRRLRDWRSAWTEALGKARSAGHAGDLSAEGLLLEPDAALADPLPPAGNYRCRTIKIGGQSEALLDYIAYQPFRCRISVENGLLSFTKLSGSQRPVGLIFAENSRRMIFLGTLQLGDERRALQYGRDRERDMAGAIERIGEERWRLVFPYPHFESTVDVLELVPDRAT